MLRQRKGDPLLPLHSAAPGSARSNSNMNQFGVGGTKRNNRGKIRRGKPTAWDHAQRWLVGISVVMLFLIGSYKLVGRLFYDTESSATSNQSIHSSSSKSKASRERRRREVKKKIEVKQREKGKDQNEQRHPTKKNQVPPESIIEGLTEKDPKQEKLQYQGEAVLEIENSLEQPIDQTQFDNIDVQHPEHKQQTPQESKNEEMMEQQKQDQDQQEQEINALEQLDVAPKEIHSDKDPLDDKASNGHEDGDHNTEEAAAETTTAIDKGSNATRCVALIPGGLVPAGASRTRMITLTPDMMNDDYCDCADGRDEWETSACSHVLVQQSVFDCGSSVKILTSRIHDGVTDCPMSGADERRSKTAPAGGNDKLQ